MKESLNFQQLLTFCLKENNEEREIQFVSIRTGTAKTNCIHQLACRGVEVAANAYI